MLRFNPRTNQRSRLTTLRPDPFPGDWLVLFPPARARDRALDRSPAQPSFRVAG